MADGGFNLSAWGVRNPAPVLFMILALTLGGILAYLNLGRAEDPNFTIRAAIVSVGWPGATAAELQDQAVDPIERTLHGLQNFDYISTYVQPGFAILQVNFKDYTPNRDIPARLYQIRKKLDDLRPSLPAGLNGPNVNDEFGDVDAVLYAISAPGATPLQLKQAADGLRRTLERVPDAEKVDTYGIQPPRIYVDFSNAKLATLGIGAQALLDSLSRQNAVIPAGTFETASQKVPVRVTGALDGPDAVGATPVDANGRNLRLSDVATINTGYKDPPDSLIRNNGESAIIVGVVMRPGANILSLGKELDAAVAEFDATLPAGFTVTRIEDQPGVVTVAVSEFMRSFAEALVIVLAVSFLSLGFRVGIVVATSVPLVLGAVFMLMQIAGIDLQRISLGALIIALGLLVDDAIIATEIMVVKLEQGLPRRDAAAFAWTSTAFPMLTGTLVTAAGFLPIGFANSAVGEYTGSIFWVVAMALLASWIVAVLFTPFLGVHLLPNYAHRFGANHDPYAGRLYRRLRRVVAFCVHHRGLVVLATIGLFVAGAAGFALVPKQFFPLSERTELFLELRLPAGASIEATNTAAREAEALLQGAPGIRSMTTYVGSGAPRFWLGLNPQQPDTAFAETVIVAEDVPAREAIKTRIEDAVAQGALAAARVRVDRFNFGPPVGFPVQFRVVGPDPSEVRRVATRVRTAMRENPDVIDPQFDWTERAPSLRLNVDQDRARALGLTPADIALAVRTALSGATATTVRDGVEQIDVVLRADADQRHGLDTLADLTIATRNGVAIQVGQVARVEMVAEEPILWRRNRDLAISVRSDVRDGAQAPDVTNAIEPLLDPIRRSLPPGYRVDTGGAIEESAKGNASIFAVFPLMIAVTLALLMAQLRNFSRMFLVILTAPLGVIGASLALNITQAPFGFVALLGLIALAGMIMRNTVILVDQIESDVAAGSPRGEAIIDATVRRSRPVVLTAFAAILAMVPLSHSAFWGPMAITIMGGLFVATFLTLLFLPALYALWFRRPLAPARATAAAAPPASALPAE